jgi:SAM-dependent methyltransferase
LTDDIADPPPELTFYHTVEFAPGRFTAGWPVVTPIVQMIIAAMDDLDLRGKRVLDVGCRDGALSFEAERRGATTVLGVDFDLPLETTSFLKAALRSKVRFEQRNVYDLAPNPDGLFDIILLPGVVYHLRHPMLALRRMRDLLHEGGILLVETATFADSNRFPLLLCPSGNNSPYEPTSCSFFNIEGFVQSARSLGLAVTAHRSLMNLPLQDVPRDAPPPIDRTVFTCVRDPRLDDATTLNYWDGNLGGPRPPNWRDEAGR